MGRACEVQGRSEAHVTFRSEDMKRRVACES